MRAQIGKRVYRWVNLRKVWLVFVAVVPQILTFFLPPTRELIPDWLAASVLVLSQAILLVFVWLNRAKPGFWALGLGLGMNLLVILANKGWMPISPATVSRLVTGAAHHSWEIGQRLGYSKDIVLTIQETHLWWLSDIFLLPKWSPIQVAFSIGDVLIAMGTIWLLWTMGSPSPSIYQEAL